MLEGNASISWSQTQVCGHPSSKWLLLLELTLLFRRLQRNP